jgi:hypothetical protein
MVLERKIMRKKVQKRISGRMRSTNLNIAVRSIEQYI